MFTYSNKAQPGQSNHSQKHTSGARAPVWGDIKQTQESRFAGFTPDAGHSGAKRDVVQLKPIHNTVYYGIADKRSDYIKNKYVAIPGGGPPIPSTNHVTIDTLNAAIGLSTENLMYNAYYAKKFVPPGALRSVVRKALTNPGAGLHQDEKDWRDWLKKPDRQQALMMNDMTPELCIKDLGYKVHTQNAFVHRFFMNNCLRKAGEYFSSEVDTAEAAAEKYKISQDNGAKAATWDEEDYNVNIPEKDFRVEDDKANLYVSNDEYGLFKKFMTVGDRNQAIDIIVKKRHLDSEQLFKGACRWNHTVLQNRFWRFTSLMGMDFFKAKVKQIEFVRPLENAGVRPNADLFPKPITDSEWKHAQDLNMIMDEATEKNPNPPLKAVKRVDLVKLGGANNEKQ